VVSKLTQQWRNAHRDLASTTTSLPTGEAMAKPPNRFAAQHWRNCAKEARDNATAINDLEGKRLMLEVATTYDLLAKKAEEGEDEAAD